MEGFDKHIGIEMVKAWTFQIFLPYYHEDWDMVDIFIQQIWKEFVLTDFWQTMMRLSYYTEIDNATRKKIFNTILATYNIRYDNGKLSIKIDDLENTVAYVMEMIAAITKISDISYVKQERIKTMFYEYFDTFMTKELPEMLKNELPDSNIKVVKEYKPEFDKKWQYVAPYAILTKDMPILFFPVLNDDRCQEAVITLLSYKNEHLDNKSIAIFNSLDDVSTKNAWRLMDLVDRPLSTFDTNKEKIIEYTVSQLELA